MSDPTLQTLDPINKRPPKVKYKVDQKSRISINLSDVWHLGNLRLSNNLKTNLQNIKKHLKNHNVLQNCKKVLKVTPLTVKTI